MLAFSSGLVMSALAAVLVFGGVGDASASGRSGGGSGIGGRSFGGAPGVARRGGFGRVGAAGFRGGFGHGGFRGGKGFAGNGFDRFGRGCAFGRCGVGGYGYAGYGFGGYGLGGYRFGGYGGYDAGSYGPPPGGTEQGIPVAAGIRPPPVLPPAVYVIGARPRVGARVRGVGRGARSGSLDTADVAGESGVVVGPRVIRMGRSR